MVYDPFNVVLDSVCSILLRTFGVCSFVILACNFFGMISVSAFGIRVMVGSQNDLGSVPPSAIFSRV